MAFSFRSALRRMALTSPRRRDGARLTVSYTAAWSAMPSRKSWHSPSWRMSRTFMSSLPWRSVPITWSSQLWLRRTPKTRACTRCLSAGDRESREHSRSTRVSAKARPSCQRVRQARAAWRELDRLLFTGALYLRNGEVSTSKKAERNGKLRRFLPITCLSAGCPLPFCKWPGAVPVVLAVFPPDCSFLPGPC